MNAVWSMTSPESGRFSSGERKSDLNELTVSFNELRARGQGYLEVRLAENAFPQLTMGFRDGHAIVHLFANEESVSLHVGDDTISSEVTVDIPVMDEMAEFTGDFILSVDRAWNVVQNFVRSRELEEAGEWCEL